MKNKLIMFLIVSTFMPIFCYAHTTLTMSTGKMTLGGFAALPIEIDKNNDTSLKLDLKPSVGLFVYDNLLLGMDLSLKKSLFKSNALNSSLGPVSWGMSVSLHYFFNVQCSVYPYLGFGLGFKMANVALSSLSGQVKIPVGILWAIRDDIALNFAVPVEIGLSAASLYEGVKIVPGYFGVMAVF